MGRGRGTRTVRSALLLAALALLPATAAPAASAPAPPPPSDPAARSWHQEGADAARTSTVDVEPLASEPEIAWKFPLPGGLLAGPVNWEGTVFVLAGPARSARLLAVDATTGGILAKREGIALKGGRPWLAAWNGSTVLVDADRTLLLHLRGARFEAGRAPEVPSACPPVLSRGVLYAASGTSFQSLHLETGRVLSSVDHHLTVRPPVALALSGGLLAGVNYRLEGGYDSPFVFASRTAVSADGVLGEAAALRYCQVNNRAPPDRPWLSILEEGEGSPALAVTAPSAFLGMESAESTLIVPGPRFSEKDARIATLAHPGVPWKGSLLGISSDGELLSVTGSGRYSVLMEKGSLPRGARPGPAAAARGVAFFGNWALDLASKRVLWTLPDLDPVTALQPAGDGRLVAVTKDGTLVGLAAKGAKAAAAPGGTAAAAGPAAAPAAPPTGADGLLLLDGTEIPGPFEQEGGSFLVGGAGGPPRSFPRAEVALATRGGKVVHLGSQGAVLDAWRRPLGAALAAALAEAAAALGREGAPAEARALLAEARAAGLPAARAEALERDLSGRRPAAAPERAAREARLRLAEARAAARAALEAASAWCAARGMPAAAAVLLEDAARAIPGSPIPAERHAALVPPEFPGRGSPEAADLWRRWAPVLADADAAFVGPDHPALRGTLRPPWDRETIHLATPFLLFSSRVADPGLVGPLLVRGERTLRALEGLLGADQVIPVRDHHDLLDVRLHRTREEYLAERLVSAFPMPWSSGCYSPAEGSSRFFVPEGGDADALGRGLAQTLSHELVHHFLDRRWKGKGRGLGSGERAAGYWCVEGIARFVEDQMDRPGPGIPRLDDPTAPCVDASAQAAAAGLGFRAGALTAISGREFAALRDEPRAAVRLRNTAVTRSVGPRQFFYENSGALVFFLLHRRGERGREDFLRYLSNHYSGRANGPAGIALGFGGDAAMDAAFAEFLRSVR